MLTDAFSSETAPFERLTVIGCGLIGGSFAMAARSVFPSLWIQVIDPNSETLQFALKQRIDGKDLADQVSLTLPEQFEPKHLIVLATHLKQSQTLLEDLAPKLRDLPDSILMDVGSCKRAIFELGKQLLPEQFIATHPMAGREFSGIHSATAMLFAQKAFLLCPHPSFPTEQKARLHHFIRQLGGLPRELDPQTHDHYMAYVSHLPQLYAIALTQLLSQHEPGRLLAYHGGGVDDQLRLSASPHSMWGEIYQENQDNVRQALDELIQILSTLKENLDSPELKSHFQQANQLHQTFHALKQQAIL